MRNFDRKGQTVCIPIDCYEELVVTEQKYNQVIYLLQEVTRGKYMSDSDFRVLLNMLGEESFTEEEE